MLPELRENADISSWNRIGKNDGFFERGNEPDSGDNKLCNTELWHLVVSYLITNVSVKRSAFIFTVEVTYEG